MADLGLREMGLKNETRPNRITKGRNKIIVILMLILIKIIIILELIIVLIIILLKKIIMLIITLITLMLIINDKKQKIRTYIKQMVSGQKWVITAAPLYSFLRNRSEAKTKTPILSESTATIHTHTLFFFFFRPLDAPGFIMVHLVC